MNKHETLDARLIRELADLRPVPPSATLRERIATALAESAPAEAVLQRRSWGPLWMVALCGPLAAVLTFFLLSGSQEPSVTPEMPEFRTEAATAAAFDEHLPSVWSYRQSISQSAADVDALLDKHAQHSFEPKPQRAGVFVFTRSQLDDFLGEL